MGKARAAQDGMHHPWLLCIHNIPPRPPYLRAKVARRLAALGAMPVKNSVYVLPDTAPHRDALVWLAQEIEQGGGKAYVCRATFDGLDGGGLSDADIRRLFTEAREADYRSLAGEFQPLVEGLAAPSSADDAAVQQARQWCTQLKARYEAVLALDFFGAQGRGAVEGLLSALDGWLEEQAQGVRPGPGTLDVADYAGRVWATRPGVHVDRIACSWLIRRFIDAGATVMFDPDNAPEGAILFDMVGGDFTHEGPHCTFEVLLRRFGLGADKALAMLGQVVHDIDLDERAPVRPESAGVLALLNGICLGSDDDRRRVENGGRLLDMLYEHFRHAGAA